MVDFTSSLYLGIKHSSAELPGWPQLTTGVPAALSESIQNKYVGNYIAGLQGFEKGMIAPSTLHIYLDLFEFLSKQKITVFIDEKIYPVSKYGIEKLIVKNIPIHAFKHLDATDLNDLVRSKLGRSTIPVVLTDGFCPQCGRTAPVKIYGSIIKPFHGKIFVDDTQAFGILGKRKDDFVYGYGGGGVLQWVNSNNENIITITSLAKAFGVPVAVISGSKNFINAFEENSQTRESSSPVSLAHLSAAKNAIIINNKSGDERRKKLLKNILLVRKELMLSSIKLNGSLFPVQSITGLNTYNAMNLSKKLNENGFKTVLTKSHEGQKPVITFIINQDHSASEIKAFTGAVKKLCSPEKYLYQLI